MLKRKHTSAFTLLEVIFVIVILGIVSSIGSKIIAQVYESYIVQRAQYRAAIKTELALNQIANRLRYAIPTTVGAREGMGTDFIPITNNIPLTSRVLQWVGADSESFNAGGWSGFCDLGANTTSLNISTPGSNLRLTNTIIANLGGDVNNTRIYFPHGANHYAVANMAGEDITLNNPGIAAGETIYERYKLAWSSYALEVNAKNDLVLHHHFAPIAATAIVNDTATVLLKNVSNFRFKGSEGALRVKICVEEQINFDSDKIHTCKERVIF